MNPEERVSETAWEEARRQRRACVEGELSSLLAGHQHGQNRKPSEVLKEEDNRLTNMTPIQVEYAKMIDIMDMNRLAHDAKKGIIQFLVRTDDCHSFFPEGSSSNDDAWVEMSSIEEHLKAFRSELDDAISQFKHRAGEMVCSLENPFIHGQDRHPPPFPGHHIPLPTQHWLAEHFGTSNNSNLCVASKDATKAVIFPYEISCTDDSLVGSNGEVNHHVCPLLLRRLLKLVGMAIHWTQSLLYRMEGALRSEAQLKTIQGGDRKGDLTLSLRSGEVLEVAWHKQWLHREAPLWMTRAFFEGDTVLSCNHPHWGLDDDVISMTRPRLCIGTMTSFPASCWAAAGSADEFPEYNEFACKKDQCTEQMQQQADMCEQVAPFLLQCEDLMDEFRKELRTQRKWDHDPRECLVSRPLIESMLRTVPFKVEEWKEAAKIRLCNAMNHIYEVDCELPLPHWLVLPNELYRGHPGNCKLGGDTEALEHLNRVLGLVGSAFCQVCEGFIRIAHAFQDNRPTRCAHLNYFARPKGFVDTPTSRQNMIKGRRLEEAWWEEEQGGVTLISITANRFMMAASHRGNGRPTVFDVHSEDDAVAQKQPFSFPTDSTPRELADGYPDAQPRGL